MYTCIMCDNHSAGGSAHLRLLKIKQQTEKSKKGQIMYKILNT